MDTIKIRLDSNQYSVDDLKKFGTRNIRGNPKMEYFFNPSNKDLRHSGYLPNLVIRQIPYNGMYDKTLYIEFSAPKIIFDNNFEEISDKDLDLLVITLLNKLILCGVTTSYQSILNAKVSKIHYSKNIIFTNGAVPSMIIAEISKCDINNHMDKSDKEFANDGLSVKWHTSYKEVAFYDKKADLKKSSLGEKRSIEKQNLLGSNILNKIEARMPFEIVRFEIRLNSPSIIKSELKLIDLDTSNLSLKELFKKEIAKRLLNQYWKTLKNNYAIHSLPNKDFDYFVANIKLNNPQIKLTHLLALSKYSDLIKEYGVRGTKKILNLYYNKRSLYELTRQFRSLNFSSKLPDTFQSIDLALSEFNTERFPRDSPPKPR